MHSRSLTCKIIRLYLLFTVGIAKFTLAQENTPTGKYLFVTKDYNAHCLEIGDGAPIDKHYPIPQQPTSALRQFCGSCSDSYNTYKVESGTSSYWTIPDQGRLNVFLGDKWVVWMINDCYPLLLRSFGSILYVLCSVGDSEQQAAVYTVNVTEHVTEQMPDMTRIQMSQVNPNVAAFFMEDSYVHLCVATGSNTLLFHNFETGQQSTQAPSFCLYISQLTPFEGANGRTQLLVECTSGRNDSVTLTMTYNTKTAQFANTSILGSHKLGKNVVSPDGSVIASCSSEMCVFSQLKVNPPITVNLSIASSAIHSASFNTVKNSLVFVVAISGPNPGLYWFNVTLALTTADEMVRPQFVNGSQTVCVSIQCPGITRTNTGFVLAAVENGTKVDFFSLSHGSHFGPIGIDKPDVARIIVIRSGEEQPTDSDGGHIPPHEPIDERTIGLSVGIPIAFIVIVITLPSLLVLVCFLYRKHSKHKRYVLKSADATRTCQPRVSRIGVALCTSVHMYVQYEGVYYQYNCYCLDTEC